MGNVGTKSKTYKQRHGWCLPACMSLYRFRSCLLLILLEQESYIAYRSDYAMIWLCDTHRSCTMYVSSICCLCIHCLVQYPSTTGPLLSIHELGLRSEHELVRPYTRSGHRQKRILRCTTTMQALLMGGCAL